MTCNIPRITSRFPRLSLVVRLPLNRNMTLISTTTCISLKNNFKDFFLNLEKKMQNNCQDWKKGLKIEHHIIDIKVFIIHFFNIIH